MSCFSKTRSAAKGKVHKPKKWSTENQLKDLGKNLKMLLLLKWLIWDDSLETLHSTNIGVTSITRNPGLQQHIPLPRLAHLPPSLPVSLHSPASEPGDRAFTWLLLTLALVAILFLFWLQVSYILLILMWCLFPPVYWHHPLLSDCLFQVLTSVLA